MTYKKTKMCPSDLLLQISSLTVLLSVLYLGVIEKFPVTASCD